MPSGEKDQPKNWRVLSSRLIYDYPPYLRLEKQVVKLPDGRQIDDYHWLQMPNYCVVVPLTTERKVVTLQAYRHGIGKVTSSLPGGLIDEGELPLIAAKRELLEETGYQSDNWQTMGSYVPHGNYGCGRVHLFRATDTRKVCEPNSGDLEQMNIQVIDIETIFNWINCGQIESLASVATILLSQKCDF